MNDDTELQVPGTAGVVLVAIGTSFRNLRDEMRAQGKRIDAVGEQMGRAPRADGAP